MSPEQYSEYILLLVQSGASGPMLAAHTCVAGRCTVCRGGNVTSGRVVWPCYPYRAAMAAREIELSNSYGASMPIDLPHRR